MGMGKRNNSIIITGLVVAFLVGTIVSAPQASAANPVLTFLQNTVMPQLDAILAAVIAIDTSFPSGTQTQIDNIETETGKIQMIKDDVGDIKTETNKIQMVKDDIAALNIGVSATTEAQIDNIETETNKIQMVKDDVGMIKTTVGGIDTETDKIQMIKDDVGTIKNNLYIPFELTILPSAEGKICDVAGGSFDNDRLKIQNSIFTNNFVVESIFLEPIGIDQDTDLLRIISLFYNSNVWPIQSKNLVDTTGLAITNLSFEILGLDTSDGNDFPNNGRFPHQLGAKGTSTPDIQITIRCDAGTTSDISFEAITISGWKKVGDTISASYEES